MDAKPLRDGQVLPGEKEVRARGYKFYGERSETSAEFRHAAFPAVILKYLGEKGKFTVRVRGLPVRVHVIKRSKGRCRRCVPKRFCGPLYD